MSDLLASQKAVGIQASYESGRKRGATRTSLTKPRHPLDDELLQAASGAAIVWSLWGP